MLKQHLRVGWQVLVVEDDYIIASSLCLQVKDCGYEVAGPAGSLQGAMQLVERSMPSAAIVNLNLHGEMAYPLIDKLRSAGIPVMIATGLCAGYLPASYKLLPFAEKPLTCAIVRHFLDASLASYDRNKLFALAAV